MQREPFKFQKKTSLAPSVPSPLTDLSFKEAITSKSQRFVPEGAQIKD